MKTEEELKWIFDQLDHQPPDGAVFRLQKVTEVMTPHPYMIGTKHLEYNSSMYIGRDQIVEMEGKYKQVHCAMKGCTLRFDEHTAQVMLVIVVPQNEDLNAVPGLKDYLLKIKGQAEALGIDGFGFPTEAQAASVETKKKAERRRR